MHCGHFQKNLPALVAENASPNLIEADRHDGYWRSLDDLLHAAVERKHEAGAGDAPLGEDTDDVAGRQGIA